MQTGGAPTGRLRRRTGLSAATAACLGAEVAVAVPLQRRNPAVVFALGLAEIAALIVLVVTANDLALGALGLLSLALMAAAVTNRHRIVAVTSGGVVLMAASFRGRPLVPLGPAPSGLALPEPTGLGAEVFLNGVRWWVERSAFPRLRLARTLLGQGGEAR